MKQHCVTVLTLALLAGACAPTVVQEEIRSGAAVSVLAPGSRTKSLYFQPFAIRNGHGDTASNVTNFTLTLIYEEGLPSTTSGLVNYDIYAITQNDKGGGASFSLDLIDRNGVVIMSQAIEGPFMRDHCTYGGPEHYRVGPIRLSRNLYDAVESAAGRVIYSSHYEGRC